MPDAFIQQIRTALGDENLQAALSANAQRRINAHATAMASLPQAWPVMRRKAQQIRQEVIANLDAYLEQFTHRAQANGLIIHRARDAAEANRIVLEIARSHQARRVAKSKTMVSEEIGLNHALEAAGLQVVETDLGEYIVQLRGERPAHIITPAVHLRRGEVGQTFHEKLSIPFTDHIPTLTATARKMLRQVFLEADIGVSGVNFAVAETGTLCILTNEGNGRMVTTLPRVHIALLGIERLVATMEDLAHLLHLLPRAATGQKLTVYTSLINAPRRAEEVDGAQERHVILVDNGRQQLLHSPLAEVLNCIRCGACINACPVFAAIGGHAYVTRDGMGSPYPGPIGSVISPALFGAPEFGHLARASSLCGACREACPVDIDLPKLLLRVRAGQTPAPQPLEPNAPPALALGLRLFTWLAISPRRFGAAQRLAGIFARLLAWRSPWLRLPAITGWGGNKDFPRPAARTFHHLWATSQREQRIVHAPSGDVRLARDSAAERAIPTQEERSPAVQGLVERFEAELSAVGGVMVRCKPEELSATILAQVKDRKIEQILAWEETRLPQGLLAGLRRAGLRLINEPDPGAGAGLTGALAGVAETGSLVLAGGPGRPLTASLLPEIHLAILPARAIYATLSEALRLPALTDCAAGALITGPSRTADIEMTLTIGVHGPAELYVFCVEDDERE